MSAANSRWFALTQFAASWLLIEPASRESSSSDRIPPPIAASCVILARFIHVIGVALVLVPRIGLPRMRQHHLCATRCSISALPHQPTPCFLLIGEIAVALLLLRGAARGLRIAQPL